MRHVLLLMNFESCYFYNCLEEGAANQEVSLVPDEIISCQICFGSLPVVFITLNATGAENLRKRLKLSAHSDPTYSPVGSGNIDYCYSVIDVK